MRRTMFYAGTLFFILAFVFTLTFEIMAAGGSGDPQLICCQYTTWCGTVGYGHDDKFNCDCIIPGGGQGWYEGCLHFCAANCPPQ